MPRLFIALEIPHDAALSLSLLRGGLPSARWVEPQDYHLTLRFIGDVSPRLADEVVAALDRIERPIFSIRLRGLDAFGSKKPHSIYAGVDAGSLLHELQGEVDRACRKLGLPADQRKFVPHVTLARLRQPKDADVAKYLALRGGFQTPEFRVDRFALFSARDSVGGGPYVLEEGFALSQHDAREQGGESNRHRASNGHLPMSAYSAR